ncbi:MAG: sulfurtransferase TusA family protein [Caulobacteraceae bacterium]|nr:sulfurtransferase TusA family protein [Caulobacteraceae bacterium]
MKPRDEILVDARGHRCPVPTLKLRRALEFAPAGATLRLLADDPLARIDVPHFAAEAGVEVLALEVEGTVISILVRNPAQKGRGAPLGERRAARMILPSS